MRFDRVNEPQYGTAEVFAYFNEACQTAQLSEALVDKCLPGELHRSHFYILNHLVRGGDGQTPLQITAAMQVTKTTISHSLSVLEKRGFIETRRSDIDARSKLVFITEEGRAFQKNVLDAVLTLYGSILNQNDIQTMGETLPGLAAIRKRLAQSHAGRRA